MATMTRRAALLAAALTAGAALAGCQTATTTTAPSATAGDTMAVGAMSPNDTEFVTNAFNIIEFDRQECNIVQSQSKNPEIRALAAEFLKQANDFDMRLRPLAASAGLKPPTVLRTDLRVRSGRLRLSQGRGLDRAFIDDQIVSHQDALNLQEDMMASPGGNPQLQELSKQGTDILRTNLAKLHTLQRKMMAMR